MAERDTISSKGNIPLHPDAQLVRACLKGDQSGCYRLYETYKRQMFRICLRYAANREDAEDFLQDGFVKIFRDLGQYRMEGPLGAWIRKVMVNSILQQLRKRKMEFSDVDEADLVQLHHAEEDFSGNLDAQILTKYIQELPDGYRTVFNLYIMDGFTHQEIGDRLGISSGTSKSQLSKARAMLQSRIAALHSHEKI